MIRIVKNCIECFMLMSARIQITMLVETANHLRLATLKISRLRISMLNILN